MKLRILFLGALVFTIAGCESSGDGTPVDSPDVFIDCSTAKCTSGSTSKDGYVVLSLSGCAPDQIGFDTVASGNVQLLCTAGACRGTVTNLTPSSFSSRSYYVCGWIDVNDDSVQNSVDAFAEDYLFVSGSPLTISNWSVSYTFSRSRRQK